MNARITPGRGWRLSLAAGALVALSIGCGADIEAPANDIGDTIQDPPAASVPALPDRAEPRRCALSPAEARAEKKSLCRE